MAALETHLEEAFAQEIDEIVKNDDMEFATQHFPFVHRHFCRGEAKPEACIKQGREQYVNFVHGLKLARQRAFYCMSDCKEEPCYEQCKSLLMGRVMELYKPLQPLVDDYLLKFVQH